MVANTTMPPLPNPLTPMAFLPPNIEAEFEACIYIAVATLGAYVWDWLSSIPEEYRMCRGGRRLALIPYFLSRVFTLVFCSTVVAFLVAPVNNCRALLYVIGSILIIGPPATLFMFFLRVKAVCNRNKAVIVFAGILWLATLGGMFVIPFDMVAEHIGTTKRCAVVKLGNVAIPVIIHLTFDTLVFIAISLRIVSYTMTGEGLGARLRSLVRGGNLPGLPRRILQGGQLYYFVTIGLCIVLATLMLSPVSLIYKLMFIAPHLALDSAMACRVFRGLKLGLIEEIDEASIRSKTIRFARNPTATTVVLPEHMHSRNLKMPGYDIPIQVEVKSEVIQSTCCTDGGSEESDPSRWV